MDDMVASEKAQPGNSQLELSSGSGSTAMSTLLTATHVGFTIIRRRPMTDAEGKSGGVAESTIAGGGAITTASAIRALRRIMRPSPYIEVKSWSRHGKVQSKSQGTWLCSSTIRHDVLLEHIPVAHHTGFAENASGGAN